MGLFDRKPQATPAPRAEPAAAPRAPLKLNMGSGHDRRPGFLNVDKFATCEPDIVADLEVFPWPWGTSEVDEMLFNHSLEHLGGTTDIFLGIMKEMYRVSRPGARIQINVPHPRHDNFLNDPTHVRPISPELMSLFSKRMNLQWKAEHSSNSPLALYLDVDFELRGMQITVEDEYLNQLRAGQLTEEELDRMIRERNNIAVSYMITLEAIK